MKNDSHDASQTRKEKELSEVTIIDLDKLDDDTDIDYDKISEEKSLTLELKDSTSTSSRSKNGIMERVLKINWHLILLIVFVFAVIFIIYRIKNWGIKVDLDKLAVTDDTEYDVEKMDNILPLIYEGDSPALNDGVRKVVLFGNDTFAENKGTAHDIANMIAELSDSTVYNCAVSGTYLASTYNYINPEDAFNLYWLTTAFCYDDLYNVKSSYDDLFEEYSDQLSPEGIDAFETLCSIDFNTVDVIGIMYDAHDYLAGKPLINHDKHDDIYCFTGNLVASIEAIQKTYPHIRIIVMSPTYAYAINPDGEYISSDLYCYLEDYKLSTYALSMEYFTTTHGVTFVDNIYGTVNETNADQYLLDHISLNTNGREKLANRFVEALTYYDTKKE